MGNNELAKIKNSLENNIGNKVRLTAKKGRKKSVTRRGVIESTYPSIFIVKLDASEDVTDVGRLVSYSYTDVLTKSIELVVYRSKNDIECAN